MSFKVGDYVRAPDHDGGHFNGTVRAIGNLGIRVDDGDPGKGIPNNGYTISVWVDPDECEPATRNPTADEIGQMFRMY